MPYFFAWRAAVFAQQPPPLNAPSPSLPAYEPGDTAVRRIAGWRLAVLWPFAMLVRLWGMSLRFESSPEDLRHYTKRDVPVAFVLWHNRLFLAPEIYRRWRRPRPLYALVSASQDGAWLTAFFSLVGMRTVRGSSSRLGREAASALVEVQRAGHDIGVTPDGPRGPCYEVKPGALIVARRTKAPLLLVGGTFTSVWRLKSWDRFILPKPFSRVRMQCELIAPEQLADRDAATALLQNRLLALNPDPDGGGAAGPTPRAPGSA
ncbi:lysophospholipid acyltransferase family protein [Horticoccus luteus]|uniref:Lysophospholipid acyltransferase family protein n=1 Tax=Horticoccus luteus TaxID=2862869 RepID=A0A8F9TU76_9BACT|nr:lysophospholipid acyltransferase family protein [Horticoccus luteus]QYM78177.1 lysophospholipid acyltransferase family protein [Horticoccus luteus]